MNCLILCYNYEISLSQNMVSYNNLTEAPHVFYRPAPQSIIEILNDKEAPPMKYNERYNAWLQSPEGQPIIFNPGLTLNVNPEDAKIVREDPSYLKLFQSNKASMMDVSKGTETKQIYGVNVLKNDESIPVWEYKDIKGETTVDKAAMKYSKDTGKKN